MHNFLASNYAHRLHSNAILGCNFSWFQVQCYFRSVVNQVIHQRFYYEFWNSYCSIMLCNKPVIIGLKLFIFYIIMTNIHTNSQSIFTTQIYYFHVFISFDHPSLIVWAKLFRVSQVRKQQ